MARYKFVEMSPRLLPVDLEARLAISGGVGASMQNQALALHTANNRDRAARGAPTKAAGS